MEQGNATKSTNEIKYYTNGCHWGGPVKVTPSFYELCQEKQIVIVPRLDKYNSYETGDRVLLISGKTVNGVAEILSKPMRSSENPELEEAFKTYNVTSGPSRFLYYNANVVNADLKYPEIRYNYNTAYYPITRDDTIEVIEQYLAK